MATATPRESRKITYSSAIRNLKKVPFTERQKAIVIGSVLGDACLHPNWSSTNYTLKITRSEKQKAYIDWQHEQLKPFVLTAPRWYEKTHSYTLRTISHSDLTSLYREFYPDGKKILPRKIKEYIRDPLTLALWFMDDGNVRRRHGVMGGIRNPLRRVKMRCLPSALSICTESTCALKETMDTIALLSMRKNQQVFFAT